MNRKSIAFLFTLCFTGGVQLIDMQSGYAQTTDVDFLQSQYYKACIQQAHRDPQDAFELSLRWQDENGGMPARHCNAISLLNLEQYQEAATRLQKLAEDMPDTVSPQIVAEILGQAGLALYLDSQLTKALGLQNAALLLHPDNATLLIDRALTHMDLGRVEDTVEDLSLVLRKDPDNLEALTYRGSAYRHQEEFDLALFDLDRVLTLMPSQGEALLERGIIYRLQGQNEAARADWLKIVEYHDGRPVADLAQRNLQKMELSKP